MREENFECGLRALECPFDATTDKCGTNSPLEARTEHFCTKRHADLEFSMTRRLFQHINHWRHCHVGDANDPR
jgi:hypothetical protein